MAIENIFIESQIVVQTAAQWAADTTVYSGQRLLVTSDQTFTGTDFRKFKIPDGIQTWSNLDYLPIDLIIAGLSSLQAQINNTGLTEVLLVNNETGGTPIVITLGDLIKSANASGTTIDFGVAGNEFYVTIDGGTGNGGYYSLLNNDVEFGIASDKLISLVTAQLLLTHATKITLNSPLINLPNLTASRFLSTDGSKNAATTKAIPSGVVVGDTDTQTLTNKTIDGDNNTVQDLDYTVFKTNAANAGKVILFDPSSGAPTLTNYQGYSLQVNMASVGLSPADATTYYFGTLFNALNISTAAILRIYISEPGTLKSVYGVFKQAGLGSSETSLIYFRLNNTTDYLISNSIVNDAAANPFSNNAMNVPVVAGDFFEIKWIPPTWTTNPTGLFCNINLSFK